MALSDYVHMTFNKDGKPYNGLCAFKSGLKLEPYKNWLYIHHAKMWKALKRPSFIEDTVAQFNSGSMTLGDVYIYAERMKSAGGMMWVAYASTYNERKKTFTYERFSGVCSYGWRNAAKFYLEKLGRLDEYPNFDWLESSYHDGTGKSEKRLEKCEKGTYKSIETIVLEDYNYDDLWQGVSPEMLAEFHKFLNNFCDEHGIKGYADSVCSAEAESVNPGDEFIGSALGLKIEKTKVGKSKKTPLLIQALVKKAKA